MSAPPVPPLSPRALQGAPSLDDPRIARQGGADELSLALMDARNRTLRWLGAFEAAGAERGRPAHPDAADVPLWWVGRAGWFQEYWIARHVQRLRGEAADPHGPRLASIEPRADTWFVARPSGPAGWDGPSPETVRAFLAQTLETTLDLLAATPGTDQAFHVFRVALMHEDRLAERLAQAAQALDVAPGEAGAPCGPPPARAPRPPLWIPPGAAWPGSEPGGSVPPEERWRHRVDVPELEIDAQPVSWARFAEFAEDGGYDDRRWWDEDGWTWREVVQRAAPRGVEQWRGGVVAQRFGRLQRLPAHQAAAHVSWHEARAWCRWAGRHLPVEVQWDRARAAAGTAFSWGDVWEWTAGSARPWLGGAGHAAPPWPPVQADPSRRVLRGASSWTVPRAAHPHARRFAAPERDEGFFGFRSCAT